MARSALRGDMRARSAGCDGSQSLGPDGLGAAFRSDLTRHGFVMLEGPFEGTADVLLVIHATGREEILSRFDADPWSAMDPLRDSQISPWALRLGSLPS